MRETRRVGRIKSRRYGYALGTVIVKKNRIILKADIPSDVPASSTRFISEMSLKVMTEDVRLRDVELPQRFLNRPQKSRKRNYKFKKVNVPVGQTTCCNQNLYIYVRVRICADFSCAQSRAGRRKFRYTLKCQ